jgi:hypothetical protein
MTRVSKYIQMLEIIYTVSFTVCIVNCVEAAEDNLGLTLVPTLVLLLVAFRLIFATKALHDHLKKTKPLPSKLVVFFHSPTLILQSALILEAGRKLLTQDMVSSLLYTSIAVSVNGFWLLTLRGTKFWAGNNLICSTVAFAFYIGGLFLPNDFYMHLKWAMIVPLLANSIIDLFTTADWYLGQDTARS